MGGGIQAEIWSGSCRLRDAKADVEAFVRLVQERYPNEGGGDLELGFKGIKGLGGYGGVTMPGEGRCEGKKRPEGDSPSGLKQTDDSLKILSYGDGDVWQ